MSLKLLINPLARGAYFEDTLSVAEAELRAHLPEVEVQAEGAGAMRFLNVDLDPSEAPTLSRLSFVQGIFEPIEGGLRCLEAAPGFTLPEALVWGAKYRGKTHELVTQLGINLALQACAAEVEGPLSLLDPMAGRGTTLLWAARYGLNAYGIEQDPGALEHLQRHFKRQAKLHRIKHKRLQGSVGKRRKDGVGRFIDFQIDGRTLKLITGDTREAEGLLNRKKFHVIVSDLPYGVQFTDAGGTRNPLKLLAECAPAWSARLKPGGALVLIFNRLQPKREALAELFVEQGLTQLPFEAPHRMSESIHRDLLLFRSNLYVR